MLTKLEDFTKDNIIGDGIRVEGGFVDSPMDRGGPTNFGITQKTANRHKAVLMSRFGWDGDMRHLTQPMAVYIYSEEYWVKIGLDAILPIAPLLADFMFKAGINCGPSKPQEWLQDLLNVLNKDEVYYNDILVDGDVGPKTIASLTALLASRPRDSMANILFMITGLNSQYYMDICKRNPGQEVWQSGWSNRIRLEYANLERVLNAA